MKMRALITGFNGFVGGYLSNLLLDKGFEVFGADRASGNSTERARLFKVDITNKKDASNLIKESKPDYIFHLAAITSVGACEENPSLAREVNVGGTENLLFTCVKHGINPRILITSSAHVYGIPKHLPIDEKHPVNPVNAYGKSKLEQENISLEYFRKHRLNVLISRSFNHIGPAQKTDFVCADFAKQIAEIEKGLKKPEISVGDLSPVRDFTDVRDIVRAYLLLLEKGIPGEIYNIGSGRGYSIKEMLDMLLSKTDKEIKIKGDKARFRKSEIPSLIANNKKFSSLTGWKPKFSIEESLSGILDYWRRTA